MWEDGIEDTLLAFHHFIGLPSQNSCAEFLFSVYALACNLSAFLPQILAVKCITKDNQPSQLKGAWPIVEQFLVSFCFHAQL